MVLFTLSQGLHYPPKQLQLQRKRVSFAKEQNESIPSLVHQSIKSFLFQYLTENNNSFNLVNLLIEARKDTRHNVLLRASWSNRPLRCPRKWFWASRRNMAFSNNNLAPREGFRAGPAKIRCVPSIIFETLQLDRIKVPQASVSSEPLRNSLINWTAGLTCWFELRLGYLKLQILQRRSKISRTGQIHKPLYSQHEAIIFTCRAYHLTGDSHSKNDQQTRGKTTSEPQSSTGQVTCRARK